MLARVTALAKRISQRREGAVAIQMGLMFAALTGMTALAIEIGFVIYKHRQMQLAADTAALGAATALSKGSLSTYVIEAKALAAEAGFVDGASGVTVTVNRPPAAGAHTSDPNAVEVVITQPQTLALAGLFGAGAFNLGVHAVALQGGSASTYCVLGLDPAASGAVFLGNNASLNTPTCGAGVNSNSNSALILGNNAWIAGAVSVVGNWSLGSNASLPTVPPPKNHAAPLTDPYASIVLSPSGAPSRTSPPSCSPSCNLSPGEYAAGWNYGNNATLNLAPGVYFIDTRLALQNNVTVNATGGVTLVLNGNYAMALGNNVTINIKAPTSGPTAGLAIAGRQPTVTERFSNNTLLNLTGAIYFPNATVQFDNNATIVAATCGQVIAGVVRLSNNGSINSSCLGTGVLPVTGSGVPRLVE